MNQARALQPSPDLCCLPSPHRILQGIAGMAFNFSRIEISHHPAPRKPQQQEKTQAQSALVSTAHR